MMLGFDHVIAAVPLDMIQLHGTETPVRVQEIQKQIPSAGY